ncbi:hypothetical protein [Nonomuraea jiangxiensis]|uniref:Secreted protein n=1 Tax=Nonomuraea jiangxiensis TaxID=633440 RepID=A0A1G9CRD4_9ACTN|nr:hypothetical protein [Nonomuraea jiangxiensis]SDK54232.1 hypothetical protein SAMN05421869_116240 [Nonomuraea jiangxiensis]
MFSRTKRVLGVAALALAAATVMAAPTQAGTEVARSHGVNPFGGDFKLLKELQVPFCLPSPQLGLPVLDSLMPDLMSCAGAAVS